MTSGVSLMEFAKTMLDGPLPIYHPLTDWLPKPPKFRQTREVSARRRRVLEKRGEYCHFVRWTVNGKCRYAWCGPIATTFNFRFGPWQSPKYQPPPVTTYSFETRYIIGDAQ